MRSNERKIAAVTAAVLSLLLGLSCASVAPSNDAQFYLLGGCAGLLALFVPALLILNAFGAPGCLKKPALRPMVQMSLLGAALTVPLTYAAEAWSSLLSLIGITAPYMGQMPDVTDIPTALSALLYVSVASALGEETLFRGLVQQKLLRRLPKAGLFIAAALFGAAHLSLYAFLPTFLLGLAAGIVCRRHTLWTAAVLHGTYNAAALLLQQQPQTQLPLLVISLAGCVLMGLTIKKD